MQREARGSGGKRKSPALVGPEVRVGRLPMDLLARWNRLGWVEVESGKGIVTLYLCTGTATVSRSGAGSAEAFSGERDGEDRAASWLAECDGRVLRHLN